MSGYFHSEWQKYYFVYIPMTSTKKVIRGVAAMNEGMCLKMKWSRERNDERINKCPLCFPGNL